MTGSYRVERSATVRAPAARVHALASDFRQWMPMSRGSVRITETTANRAVISLDFENGLARLKAAAKEAPA